MDSDRAIPTPQPPHAKSGLATWKWVVLSLFITCFGCILISGIVYFSEIRPKSERDLTASELKAILTLEDVKRFYEVESETPIEKTAKFERFFNGISELTYSFKSNQLLIYYFVTVDHDFIGAHETYKLARLTQFGEAQFGDEGVEYVEQNGIFNWGDRRQIWFMQYKGESNGMHLIAQKGRYTFEVTLIGIEAEQEVIQKLVVPKLDATVNYLDQPNSQN